MILWLLILVPAVLGIITYFIRQDGIRRALWLLVAFSHFGLSAMLCLWSDAAEIPGEWIGLDALSRIFLPLTGLLFAASTVYAVGSFKNHDAVRRRDSSEIDIKIPRARPEAVFTGCMLLFLAGMNCVIVSRKFGLQWVSIEATTLASTPLIYYHRDRRSLEAAWKYILLCSVGIAVALLGVFSLALASAGLSSDLTVNGLLLYADQLDPRWLKLSFVFILVGYGTKMGLAPLHTWLPDAHSEAPSPVSALLSGALLNCAFLGILRIQQIMVAAGVGAFSQNLLVIFGLISMGVAGVFILRQPDYKRLLAYSSVEHMGIIVLGAGLAESGAFGSLLHAVNHSLVKTMLFMTAGNILAVYGTKRIDEVRGVNKLLPLCGALWLGGFFAITGSPPFGTFISELTILKTALDQGRWIVAGLFLAFLALIFIGMASAFIRMSLGPKDDKIVPVRLSPASLIPPVLFGAAALVLGLYIPSGLNDLLKSAAALIGGGAL